ncbi:hypothetical protein KA057_02345 [Candidatus Gracilibacteria bacterium]|nr:hypothetical protein [Candidatus Gracilibacteria bacterium]
MYGNFSTLSLSSPEGTKISPGYTSVLDRLVIPELTGKNGHSLQAFFGGPVIIGHKQHWLRPIFFDGFNVHVLYANCAPDDVENSDIIFLRNDDIGFKLGDAVINHTDNPSVIIRQCLSGNIMFPNVVYPINGKKMREDDFHQLAELLGLRNKPVKNLLADAPEYFSELTPNNRDGIYKLREGRYTYKDGYLYVADFVLENDPWKHYQIISRDGVGGLLDSDNKGSLVRIDSGCDSGQIYGDEACECREQLHESIDAMLQEGGIIIHIPTQDGRGYGCAPKMETEGLKEGLPMRTNEGNIVRMDTVEAALHLFGEHYDIRTFHGSGRILRALGLEHITLLTDSKRKIDQIMSAGIEVDIRSIKVDKPSCARHMDAKYQTPLYIPR